MTTHQMAGPKLDRHGRPPAPLSPGRLVPHKTPEATITVLEREAFSNGVSPDEPEVDEVLPYDIRTTEPGGPRSKAHAKLEPQTYVDGAKRFPRISKPVELLRHEYDVLVIGSGYGGGVAASRMARGGQSVCILERGKEKWRKPQIFFNWT